MSFSYFYYRPPLNSINSGQNLAKIETEASFLSTAVVVQKCLEPKLGLLKCLLNIIAAATFSILCFFLGKLYYDVHGVFNFENFQLGASMRF